MSRRVMAKIVSGALIAVGFALVIYHSYFTDQAMGKQAYLQKQSARFDLYMTHPSIGGALLGSVFLFAALYAGYELLSFCISWGMAIIPLT